MIGQRNLYASKKVGLQTWGKKLSKETYMLQKKWVYKLAGKRIG